MILAGQKHAGRQTKIKWSRIYELRDIKKDVFGSGVFVQRKGD